MSNTNINVESIVNQIRTYASIIKFALLAAVVGGGVYAARSGEKVAAPVAAQPVMMQAQPQPVINGVVPTPQLMPAVASNTSTVTFLVASVGRNSTRTAAYLNSQLSYKVAGNQSVQLSGAAASLPVETFIGKTVSATGLPKGGQPGTIVISDPTQLRVQ